MSTTETTTPRAIHCIGWDGRSAPILRFADERELPSYQQASPSVEDIAAWNQHCAEQESARLFARWQGAEAAYCRTPNTATERAELVALRAFVAHAEVNNLPKRGF